MTVNLTLVMMRLRLQMLMLGSAKMHLEVANVLGGCRVGERLRNAAKRLQL